MKNGNELLHRSRRGALVAIAAFIVTADLVAFAGSYLGLYAWAARHGLAGWRAYAFPLMVDTFVAVGELALFVSLASGWPRRTRIGAAVITGIGLAASVAGNVGHEWTGDWWTRATWAVPPLAASAALAIGLTVLKWTAAEHRKAVSVAVSVKRKLPTVREIQDRQGCGQATAVKARDEVRLDRRIRETEDVGASPVAPTGGGRGTPPIPPAAAPLKNGGRDAKVTVPATQNGSGPRE